MNLERSFQDWQSYRNANPVQAHAVIVESAKGIHSVDAEALKWMAAALTDDERKFFVAALYIEANAMPEELYEPMLRAAIYELNPLQVQTFVEPCVKAFGVPRVVQTLVDYFERGTDFEKTGAVNAMHWASERKSTTESGRHKPVEPKLLQLLDYRRSLYLQTFLKNPDVDLRRAIITNLELDPLGVPMMIQEQIDKVIKTARTHTDEYIRHRVEVQLKRSPSAYPLPPRKRTGTQVMNRKSGWWKQLWK